MTRPAGSKDRKPRVRRWRVKPKPEIKPVSPVTPQPFMSLVKSKDSAIMEGCDRIIESARKAGLLPDLWIMLDCFRRIKNL